jgi:hypothetical protein
VSITPVVFKKPICNFERVVEIYGNHGDNNSKIYDWDEAKHKEEEEYVDEELPFGLWCKHDNVTHEVKEDCWIMIAGFIKVLSAPPTPIELTV